MAECGSTSTTSFERSLQCLTSIYGPNAWGLDRATRRTPAPAGRSRPIAASFSELGYERDRSHALGHRPCAAVAGKVRCHSRVLRSPCHHRRLRDRNRWKKQGPYLRNVLYDKIHRDRNRTYDLPFDHRVPWRDPPGARQPSLRDDVSCSFARRRFMRSNRTGSLLGAAPEAASPSGALYQRTISDRVVLA